MPLMEWSPDIATNQEMMDDDHRHLLALINRLEEERVRGATAETLDAVFAELQLSAREHFRREEALMAKIRYRDASDHRTQHRVLTMMLDRLADEHKARKTVLSTDTMRFLVKWLAEHIRRDDRPLARAVLAARPAALDIAS